MREDQDLLGVDGRYAHLIENMDRDPEGFWTPAPGTVPFGTWAAGSGAILALTVFAPQANIRWLVAERNLSVEESELVYLDLPAGVPVQFATRRRASGHFDRQFLQLGRWLYHFNGLETPIRWDGQRTSPVGYVTAPGPPRALGGDQGLTDNAGTPDPDDRSGTNPTVNPPVWDNPETEQRGVGEFPSSDAPWRYGYAVTWVNDLGQESPLSSIVWASGKNTTSAMRKLVRITVDPAPDHIRGVRLYRTRNLYNVTGSELDSAAQLYLHSEWSTAAGFDLMDLKSDSDLAPDLFDRDSVGPVPPGIVAAAFWQGRMWLLTSDGQLRYSSALFPEQFPAINRIPVGSSASGAGIALYPIPKGLLVWTEGGTFLVKPVGSTFGLEELSSTIGCAAQRSIVQIPGLGLAWLARTGPHVLTGILEADQPTRVQPVPGIRKTWRRQALNLRASVVLHDPDLESVWWHIPEGGNVKPELGIVWHYGVDGWSTRPAGDWPIGAAVRYRGRTYVGSHNDDPGKAGVHVLTRGSSTRFGVAADGGYVTGWVGGNERILLTQLLLHVLGTGDTSVALSWRGDRADAFTSQADTDRALQHAEHERDRWAADGALWTSDASWSDYEPAAVRTSLFLANAHAHQFRLRGARLNLIAFEPQAAPGGGPLSFPWLER